MYAGARAVVIPARTGTTGEPTTRRVVVAADRRSFTLDDGQVYDRLSGALWSQRYSVDLGTLLVRQAYTEGAALFEGLWRSAVDPAPRTAAEVASAQEQVVVEELRAHHRIPPWSRPDFYYDVARARDVLAGLSTDVTRIPDEKFWAVLEHHRRTPAEIAGLNQPVGPDCLTAEHGTCRLCRPVHVWAWVAERRWSHHGGDPSVSYDVGAILALLERIDPDYRHTPGRVLTRVLDEHHRTDPEVPR
ncbi:hypothetical protein QYM41_08165 [Kocuria sp. CPCC 205268]|uniref:hypothetical protein n=1 Tax=Kocuria oxytropis TaxID=3058913 RepID=UPI0034D78550